MHNKHNDSMHRAFSKAKQGLLNACQSLFPLALTAMLEHHQLAQHTPSQLQHEAMPYGGYVADNKTHRPG
jgi:hypothetical protein